MVKDVPMAAKPSKVIFDPFNSSATGHQRADSKLAGSTSWRDSRLQKLRKQYISGTGGGKRVSDTVGAGSEDFGRDGRLENGGWAPGAKGLRSGGQRSIQDCMRLSKPDVERAAKRVKMDVDAGQKPNTVVSPFTPFRKADGSVRETSWTSHEERQDYEISVLGKRDIACMMGAATKAELPERKPVSQIFAGLTIYINGSTAPLVSDHRLKYLLSTHGAQTSVALGRKTVTHAILSSRLGDGRCGGSLAGSKLHKEITKVRGKGIKFVTAAWITESVAAGKRLSEARYQGLDLGSKGVQSVGNIFSHAAERELLNENNDDK